MKPIFLTLALLVCPVLARADRPFFTPPPLSSFDGQSWGPLRLGQTTFKEIRPLFETGEGVLPASTELSQPKNSPMRVDLLWQKQDGREVLGAIAIEFKQDGAAQSDILKAFAGQDMQTQNDEEILPRGVEALYQPNRFEQWRVLRFPARGVAAFQMKNGDSPVTPLLLFGSKEGLNTFSQTLSSEYSSPVERVDPNKGKPRIADFSGVFVSSDFDNELDISRRTRRFLEEKLEARIRNSSGEGALRYRPFQGGSYTLSLDVNHKRDGGSVNATAKIEAAGPYGPIVASGTGYGSWKRKDGDDRNRLENAFLSAGQSAMESAERSFAKKMRESGPPPLEVVRWQTWRELLDKARSSGALAPIRF